MMVDLASCVKFLHKDAHVGDFGFDSTGRICIWNESKLGPKPTTAEMEQFAVDHAAEIEADKTARDKLAALAATDAGVISGVDDLWALLVSKGVLKAEDVPAELKAKLDEREALRTEIVAASTAEK